MGLKYTAGGYCITRQQLYLLRAALWKGPEAIHAWKKWLQYADVDSIDPGSYRLLPLLYRNMHLHGVNDPLMDRIKGLHRYTWVKNQLMFNHLSELIDAFQTAGIKTLVLKGAALIKLYYKDTGLRPMSDIDILVPFNQAEDAIRLLLAQEWIPYSTYRVELSKQYRLLRHGQAFKHARGDDLDLHWHVLPTNFEEDADDDFWKGAVPLLFNKSRTLALNASDQLLNVCVHGIVWNMLPSLRWVADAVFIFRGASEIEWDRIIDQAQKKQLVSYMRESLRFLQQAMEVSVPTSVLKTLESLHVSILKRIEFKVKTRPAWHKNVILCFLNHYTKYSRLKRILGSSYRPFGFVRFLKLIWHKDHLGQILFYAIARGFEKIRERI